MCTGRRSRSEPSRLHGDLDWPGSCPGRKGCSASMARPRKGPEELLERGGRLVFESGRPLAHLAKDLGVSSEVLRKRVGQAEADSGARPDLPPAAERDEIRKLRREY